MLCYEPHVSLSHTIGLDTKGHVIQQSGAYLIYEAPAGWL